MGHPVLELSKGEWICGQGGGGPKTQKILKTYLMEAPWIKIEKSKSLSENIFGENCGGLLQSNVHVCQLLRTLPGLVSLKQVGGQNINDVKSLTWRMIEAMMTRILGFSWRIFLMRNFSERLFFYQLTQLLPQFWIHLFSIIHWELLNSSHLSNKIYNFLFKKLGNGTYRFSGKVDWTDSTSLRRPRLLCCSCSLLPLLVPATP